MKALKTIYHSILQAKTQIKHIRSLFKYNDLYHLDKVS